MKLELAVKNRRNKIIVDGINRLAKNGRRVRQPNK
jgi:ribosomal protein L24